MAGLLALMARNSSLKKHRSKVPTGMTPLDEIKKATVFVDSVQNNFTELITEINDFFENRQIEVRVFVLALKSTNALAEGQFKADFLHRKNINWYGRIKRNKRTPQIPADDDLFISLSQDDCYPIEYAARTSNARFKIGRTKYSDNLYDIVFTNGKAQKDDLTAFRAISDFLTKVR